MAAPQGPPPGYGGPPAPHGAPGYGPGPAYGAPYGYPYGPPTVEHPQGTIVLVLGILGIVMCQVLGPVAWVMGNRALQEIDASPGSWSNRGNVQAGRICGIVATVILGLWVAFFGLYAVVAIGVLAGSST
ncbi:DUF4190 domain-containing protein [Iamia majanohamensis]|uniref:DUF4190 domain-containing protein n=1 Tax=Iamia majanohamensis TaxID=467976 RepID=A0AAF0BUX6_9ACTN|nr:DUF4190 domain-containing protein [Iamia majanohamensis]WCO66190.1 DUF4190 domain-containing protein [Iamia majanohamensis]